MQARERSFRVGTYEDDVSDGFELLVVHLPLGELEDGVLLAGHVEGTDLQLLFRNLDGWDGTGVTQTARFSTLEKRSTDLILFQVGWITYSRKRVLCFFRVLNLSRRVSQSALES